MSEYAKHEPCDNHKGWGSNGCVFCEDGRAEINRNEILRLQAINAELEAEIDELQQRRIEIGEQNAKLFVTAKIFKAEKSKLREALTSLYTTSRRVTTLENAKEAITDMQREASEALQEGG